MENNFEKEMIMEFFTKYINSRLKGEWKVENWAFSVPTNGEYSLILQIDYIEDFHSRDIFEIIDDFDIMYITALQTRFNSCLQKHLDELDMYRFKKINAQCGDSVMRFDRLLTPKEIEELRGENNG